jgi:Polyketide cyclase / dehydrase and lipid transport
MAANVAAVHRCRPCESPVGHRDRLGAQVKRVSAVRRYDVRVECGFAFITNTENWSRFWPGYVRLQPGSRWSASGDEARLVTRLLGAERELTMTLSVFEPNQLVAYTSTQPGLPDAYHERHFERDGSGFLYRLVVQYEPRRGIARIFDTMLLPRAIRRVFERTFTALEQEFSSGSEGTRTRALPP